jgi:hypothetical protein
MNKPLLRKVAKRIKDNPELYNQDCYCGSVCCIAGHAVLIHDKNQPFGFGAIPARAKEILLLNEKQFQSSCVFVSMWPYPYKERYRKAKTAKGQAKVAHDRIMHLIKTGE